MMVYRRYVTPATSVRIGDGRFNSFCGKTYKCLRHFARLIIPRYFRTVPMLIRPLKMSFLFVGGQRLFLSPRIAVSMR